MKEFLFLFRDSNTASQSKPSPEQMQANVKPWQDWMGSLAAQNKLASAGNRLGSTGKVVRPGNVITDGPFVEVKEAIGGYIIVNASSLEEATELAKGCPIFQSGGNVEVRDIVPMQM